MHDNVHGHKTIMAAVSRFDSSFESVGNWTLQSDTALHPVEPYMHSQLGHVDVAYCCDHNVILGVEGIHDD